MTYPTIPTSGAGRIVSSANTNPAGTHTFPNLNTLTKNADDLLIALCITYDGNSTNAEFSSWGGGFTEFVDQTTTTTMGIGGAYKVSTGSETGTFTVTSADTSANDSVCILLSIPGAHTSTAPAGGTIANGTAAAANITSLNPSGWDVEDTLWIAVAGAGEDSTTGSFTAPSAAPTNYSNLFATAVTADVVGGVYGAVAFRQLRAASDDPATFTVDVSQARNSSLLIAVRPAVADPVTELFHAHDAQQITGLADGAAVSQWDDVTGNGRHLVQATGTSQPTYQTGELNGWPGVQFTTDDFMATADYGPNLSQPCTQIVVFKHTSIATAQNFTDGITFDAGNRQNAGFATGPNRWYAYAGGATSIGGGTPDTTGVHVLIANYDGDSSTLRIDGTQVATGGSGAPGTNFNDGLRVGSDPGGTSDLEAIVGEIQIWSGIPTNLTAIEASLISKWRTPPPPLVMAAPR